MSERSEPERSEAPRGGVMDAMASGETPSEIPPPERWRLEIRRCWSPPCPYIAVVRDGMGWWWCHEHLDRVGWDVAERVTHSDMIARVARHLGTGGSPSASDAPVDAMAAETAGAQSALVAQTWEAAINVARSVSLCVWCRSGQAPVAYLTRRMAHPGEHFTSIPSTMSGYSICGSSTLIAAMICARDAAILAEGETSRLATPAEVARLHEGEIRKVIEQWKRGLPNPRLNAVQGTFWDVAWDVLVKSLADGAPPPPMAPPLDRSRPEHDGRTDGSAGSATVGGST